MNWEGFPPARYARQRVQSISVYHQGREPSGLVCLGCRVALGTDEPELSLSHLFLHGQELVDEPRCGLLSAQTRPHEKRIVLGAPLLNQPGGLGNEGAQIVGEQKEGYLRQLGGQDGVEALRQTERYETCPHSSRCGAGQIGRTGVVGRAGDDQCLAEGAFVRVAGPFRQQFSCQIGVH